jgi:hypothetical protein
MADAFQSDSLVRWQVLHRGYSGGVGHLGGRLRRFHEGDPDPHPGVVFLFRLDGLFLQPVLYDVERAGRFGRE